MGVPSHADGIVQFATPEDEIVPDNRPALTRPSIAPFEIRATVDQRPEGMHPAVLSQVRRHKPSNGCRSLDWAIAGAICRAAKLQQTIASETLMYRMMLVPIHSIQMKVGMMPDRRRAAKPSLQSD
jgi:hypothetical protein